MNQQIVEALKQLGGKGTFGQIWEIVQINKINLHRLLRTMCKRGELLREFIVTGTYRYGHVAVLHKRDFVYSLP